MTTTIDRFNPTFALFPIQNNRTAWKPVYLPAILVIPQMRSSVGNDVPKAMVSDIKFYIEDAPGKAKVSGFEHIGLYVPQYERFVKTISNLDLNNYTIDVTGQSFIDQNTGEEKSYSEAINGDSFWYVIENGGVRDKLVFYKDANYYDLSTITIDTIELNPYRHYNFVWQASYKERIITPDNELYCIGDQDQISRLSILFNHPGDVHRAMVQHTPPVYFDGSTLDKDGTVNFYRPFADVLQDIFDEQTFIRGINWVNNIPAQYIPYLAYLIGWDLPYYSGIDDNVRRSFIKNARKLQKLKGAKRAISELFEIFGFTIDIVNLWYRSDGKAFIGPYDPIEEGFENDYVKINTVCTTEPIIADNNESGFGQVQIPLLYRPNGDFTIEAYLVSDGQSRTDLNNIINKSVADPDSLDQDSCNKTPDGMYISDTLSDVNLSSVVGFSKILVSYKYGNGTAELRSGTAPLNKNGIVYDKDTNQITISYDRYLDLSSNRLFIFAVYQKDKIIPSKTLTNLRSNRFDIRVLLFKNGEQPDSDIYDYLLDFLFKIKAFHSLLRKITYSVNVADVYNVTDFQVGGVNKQSPDTEAGNLQVPPAIIPTDPTCSSDQKNRGFKDSDLNLRKDIISGLEDEHKTWKDLDGTHEIPGNLRQIVESLSRIPIPDSSGKPCEFTYLGQDRVLTSNIDFDQNPDNRPKLCDLSGNLKDYTYKGRAKDFLSASRSMILSEQVRCHPCTLGLGYGLYWSGSLGDPLQRWMSPNRASFSDLEFSRRAAWNDTIHFTNRSLIDLNTNQAAFLAIQRPSLEIQKSNLFFPGHRFIRMYALPDVFVHPIYDFRPWDDLFNLPCPEDIPIVDGIPVPIPDLHSKIVTDTNGDEWLIFDSVKLVYYGNGLSPDINSLGNHIGSNSVDENDVTHEIYSTQIDTISDERVYEFDSIIHSDDESICIDKSRKIFDSANESCVCETGGIKDYIDGYPAITGAFAYNGENGYIDNTDRSVWAEILGLPEAGSDIPIDLLFKVGSGIRAMDDPSYKPYRLDCGCDKYACDSGATGVTSSEMVINRCNLSNYLDDGKCDFNCDKVNIFQKMILSENFGTCSFILDGEIPSLFLVDENKITWDKSGPVPIGSYKFVDDWGTIHLGVFKTSGDILDITWTTMEPRVWGEPDSGFKDETKVFRRGIITTQRQVMQIVDGKIYIMAQGAEQYIGYFQSNMSCGDTRFLDPFLFHVDCGIADQVMFEVKCGPRWSDPANIYDLASWPSIGVDSSGNAVIGAVTGDVPFYWIDVWGNDEGGEITSDCK